MTRLRRPVGAVLAALLAGSAMAACETPSPDPDAPCAAVGTQIPEAAPSSADDDRVDDMDGAEGAEWVAGDSTYSVPLPDGRVLWLYSDSVIGAVDRRGNAKPGNVMVHNALVVQDRDGAMRTITGTKDGRPSSFFPDVSQDTYYWVQDASIDGEHITVFLSRTTGKGTDFKWTGTAIGRIRLTDLTLESITDAPATGRIAWGAGIMETKEATYVYGIEDVAGAKHLHLAQAPPGALTDRARWTYRTKGDWSGDPARAARLTDGVANELSVQPYKDGYLMISSDSTGIFSPKINAWTACHPHGPWRDPQTIYETPESGEGEHFTYNAHAHPGLPGRDGGELLVSYNVNTFDTEELFQTPTVYRPRFITLRP